MSTILAPKRKRQNRLLSHNSLSDAQNSYLRELTGRQHVSNGTEALATICHLRSIVTPVHEVNIVNNLQPNFYPQEDNMSRVLRFLGRVGSIIRQDNNASIEKVMRTLLGHQVLKENEHIQNKSALVLALFGALGWMTLLYLPSDIQSQADKLSIKPEDSASSSRQSISINYTQRPFVELARAFGPLLPEGMLSTGRNLGEQQKPTNAKLYISSLNASTLRGLAGIRFVWVDTITGHLDFDPDGPTVKLFRCPSHCKIMQDNDSIASLLLQSYYDEDEMPSGFSWPNLARELLQTYHIIFKDDRGARKIYQKHERREAAISGGGITDSCLDEVCGAHLSTSRFKLGGPVRESYDAEGDFPLFCRRLLRIQEYIEGIQPNRFTSLWRDRRDLQRWYTLWLVLIVGVISVVRMSAASGHSGSLSIPGLVDACLLQVEKYNPSLRALLYTAPRQNLLQIAAEREQEWQTGKGRGPLHGIPIILKDNINTDPSLGMPTTAGSLALLDARPRKNAALVDLLVDAGAIILGKANLSEFMNCKGRGMMAGWSAVGGQCVSAYVEGGIKPGDKYAGHSSPGGSSTGSAVGVSAGFAPVAIGAETSGSLVEPATRAALYTLKPTIHLISQQGLVPVAHTFDSAGPMTKSSYDLAVIMDVLAPLNGEQSYTEALKSSWSELRIGALHPAKWRKDAEACEPNPGANAQMDEEILSAYRTISSHCAKFVEDLELTEPDMRVDGTDAFGVVNNADYKADLTAYLQDLEFSHIRSIQQLIDFNKEHHDQELPTHHPRQDVLEMVVNYPVSVMDAKYKKCLEHLQLVARDQGIEYALRKNNVDVIIGPADSELASIAAAAGYPIATMPLSYLKLNGRPFGVVALASANEEKKLIQTMSAWESTFPDARRPPIHYGLSSPHE
ncbi:hypothetical protein O1611_g1116 [Lasiodiplodia mahajangana]|uniref:Uncharacterized protein n=1 Tax=Lasiodiplodia mahajangana TaxID=1108764 RepID=A0ACC2JYD7_9PEZI|nr:hypothetical protein O1611_g1116 [Lasiodiplodia mahajangana]